MTISLKRGNESAEITGHDGLLEADPYYRATFERQVTKITMAFYGLNSMTETETPL